MTVGGLAVKQLECMVDICCVMSELSVVVDVINGHVRLRAESADEQQWSIGPLELIACKNGWCEYKIVRARMDALVTLQIVWLGVML